MKVSCELEFRYGSEKTSTAVAGAVSVDDYSFVDTCVEGNKIKAVISADSVMSLVHTLEDYLSCISVAEKLALTPQNSGHPYQHRDKG